MSSKDFNSLKEAIKKWKYQGFTLSGARRQGGYVEMEAEHPNYSNIRARGRTLHEALEGLKRHIDTQFNDRST